MLITDPLTVEDFKDSLVLFDDTDSIGDKKQRREVYNIMNQILQTGRHFNVSALITNHLPTAREETRHILNECHSITYFPHSGNLSTLKRLLVEIVGLDTKDIKKIKDTKSRWATIYKNYPQICLTEKDIWLLSNDD